MASLLQETEMRETFKILVTLLNMSQIFHFFIDPIPIQDHSQKWSEVYFTFVEFLCFPVLFQVILFFS